MRKTLLLLFGVAAAGSAGLASAADAADWLSPATVQALEAIPPPPSSGSAEEKADFDELLALQSSRTAADCKRAETEVKVTLPKLFGPPYGPLSAADAEKMAPLFERIREQTNVIVQWEKKHWKRPRPYVTRPALKPCIPKEYTAAYPSGHSAISRVFARSLAWIDPDNEPAYLKRADQIAHDRVLGGVHHPADIAEGKALGDRIFEEFKKNPDFLTALNQMKKPKVAYRDFISSCLHGFNQSQSETTETVGRKICECTVRESKGEHVPLKILEAEGDEILRDSKHVIQDRRLLASFQNCAIEQMQAASTEADHEH